MIVGNHNTKVIFSEIGRSTVEKLPLLKFVHNKTEGDSL
jgi:hypothetical protein